jgi:hypothetical protein
MAGTLAQNRHTYSHHSGFQNQRHLRAAYPRAQADINEGWVKFQSSGIALFITTSPMTVKPL